MTVRPEYQAAFDTAVETVRAGGHHPLNTWYLLRDQGMTPTTIEEALVLARYFDYSEGWAWHLLQQSLGREYRHPKMWVTRGTACEKPRRAKKKRRKRPRPDAPCRHDPMEMALTLLAVTRPGAAKLLRQNNWQITVSEESAVVTVPTQWVACLSLFHDDLRRALSTAHGRPLQLEIAPSQEAQPPPPPMVVPPLVIPNRGELA